MAVEARHMSLFPPQLITSRGLLKSNQGNGNIYNTTQMDSGLPNFSETMPDQLLPFYQSVVYDPISAKTSMNKADSGLTYNIPAPRKRPRDSINGFDGFTVTQPNKISGFSSLLDDDIIFQIQQQQSEIDRLVAEHTEKVKLELEERRKRQSRMLVSAIQEGIVKKLKEKDEEIQRMGKLNWVLQERVKSLCVENQLWRDLAQTNEATANSLRSNLEQVLAHVSDDRHVSGGGGATVADDAESSCGSSDHGREIDHGWRTLAAGDHAMLVGEGDQQDKAVVGGGNSGNMKCKRCGERESSVLLLPCRHLCLCTMCGSTLLRTCPVCDSVMKASVHVNMS